VIHPSGLEHLEGVDPEQVQAGEGVAGAGGRRGRPQGWGAGCGGVASDSGFGGGGGRNGGGWDGGSGGGSGGGGAYYGQTEAPRLPPGGLIAHPVGAGKTVIAAAYLARAAATDAAERTDAAEGRHK